MESDNEQCENNNFFFNHHIWTADMRSCCELPFLGSIQQKIIFTQSVCTLKSQFENFTQHSASHEFESNNLNPSSSLPFYTPVILAATQSCHKILQLFFILLQSLIYIPFQLFFWTVGHFLSLLQQLFSSVFIVHDLHITLLLLTVILLCLFLRQRFTYWRVKNIPYECLTAHLSLFPQFTTATSRSSSFFDDDVHRVRRYGKIFGSFKWFRPVLCIANLQTIEQILYTQSDYFTWQNTWPLESHHFCESIFANTSTTTLDIQRWKRKKSILLSAFLSRKIKLLKPTIDGLMQQWMHYIASHLNDVDFDSKQQKQQQQQCISNGELILQMRLDKLVFPWLLYSMLELIFDIEMPTYEAFVTSDPFGAALISSFYKFFNVNRQIQQNNYYSLSNTISMFTRYRLFNMHLFNECNLKQMQTVIDGAIRYRVQNGLLGLSDCPKRPSKKSVKFREQVYSRLIVEGDGGGSGENEAKQTDASSSNSGIDSTRQQQGPPPAIQARIKELTFIDIILNYEIEPEDKLEGYELSRQELLDNLTAFFTVSLFTLSTTISAALFYLALHPAEQNKVHQEVVDHIGTRSNITWESLRNLKYTEAFLKEVLRLNPPVDRINRVVTKDCSIQFEQQQQQFQQKSCLTLAKGLLCSILVSAVHRDPDTYPQPNEFRPERFYAKSATGGDNSQLPPPSPSIENKPDVNCSKFLAFGLGPRSCIGLKFVIFYLKHLLTNLLFDYEIKLSTQTQKSLSKHQQKQQHWHINQILSSTIELVARITTTTTSDTSSSHR